VGSLAFHANLLVVLQHAPLTIEVFGSGAPGTPLLVLNRGQRSYLEHRRKKDAPAGGEAAATPVPKERRVLHWDEAGKAVYEDEGEEGSVVASATPTPPPTEESGQWEESFQSHTDSKPAGPQSVGFDVTFPRATHLYGIPEHASSHALHTTTSGEAGGAYSAPYRLYNLDVFEYELDNPMSLYGSIPFLISSGAPQGLSSGVFWNNPTETYVDISKDPHSMTARWISEAGVFDLMLLPGPASKSVVYQFTKLVGTVSMPPLFALGYHQCRWNYKDEADVFAVDGKFEELAFPYDVLWLDIEHTDGKRYFTWDSTLFPNPVAMQEKLAARGHKMVTIIDPHIKKDPNYWIHSEAVSKELYLRKADGGEYEGWCWPGSSGYLDFTSPKVRDWWASQFSTAKYKGSTLSLYTWNDMNEPSVFNGPEVSMHKDARSLEGVEHREWHNLYGFYQTMATAEGQLRRTPDRSARSFVLSRAFYAGTQRHAAIWTGDNDATWAHLAQAAPMLLTIGVSGLTFAGADVGGFFHNPTPELMVRWYEAGSFQPFFRAHAHIDTARREPWLFGESTMLLLRNIVRTRYTYLPLWYTLFAAANATGVPVMRPLWMEYPEEAVQDMDAQWLVGSELLVKPVTSEGALSHSVYFPGTGRWYRADTLALERKDLAGGKGGGTTQVVEAPLGRTTVFQRGGAIVPRLMRPRRSSAQMAGDPYTLVVTLDEGGRAAGWLYLDDMASHEFHTSGAYRLREFSYMPSSPSSHSLKSSLAAGGKLFAPENTLERVLVAGAARSPKRVSLPANAANSTGGVASTLDFTYDASSDTITIRKPNVKVAYDFEISIEF